MTNSKLLRSFFVAVVITVLFLPNVAFGQGEGWQFGIGLYGWYTDANLEGHSGRQGEVEASYILDNFDMGYMGTFEAQKNNLLFLVDVFYISSEDDSVGTPLLRTNVELNNQIISPIVAYRFVENDSFELSVLGGARYLYVKTEVTAETKPPLPYTRQDFSDSFKIWDGVVGLRGRLKFSKLFLPFHLDIGTGDSDATWQAFAGIGYKFSWCDIIAGYRYIDWEFDDSMSLVDLDHSGPIAGVKFRF